MVFIDKYVCNVLVSLLHTTVSRLFAETVVSNIYMLIVLSVALIKLLPDAVHRVGSAAVRIGPTPFTDRRS